MARYKIDEKTGDKVLVEADTKPHPRPKPRQQDGKAYFASAPLAKAAKPTQKGSKS